MPLACGNTTRHGCVGSCKCYSYLAYNWRCDCNPSNGFQAVPPGHAEGMSEQVECEINKQHKDNKHRALGIYLMYLYIVSRLYTPISS